MNKMQVEEMHHFFSQKITYKGINALLHVIYLSVNRYSVKSGGLLLKKLKHFEVMLNIFKFWRV